MGVFDIRTEFSKYGEYHANKVNVAIHMVFVPTILWTALGITTRLFPQELFAYPPLVSHLLSYIPGPSPLANSSTIAMLAYILFYAILDPIAGLLITPVIYSFLVTSQQFAIECAGSMKVMVVLFVVAWVAQFIGHGVFERRAPALVDNLVQALVMAPFFVFLEVLFACGYRPDLNRELRNEIGSRILAFRRKSKKSD
ncbi:hypothetical protein LPJ78_002046 [Coemansia sp. RSA 989]|nr:hypothetical protein LPJ68_004613 [Coemansia sp. RSA 1086]KAJ1751505.1 hypothetical protein LPJ79_001983 [Coemansia sp. RSA 1821]KAJ1866223.1 hypothetical protein LPJ78_002046 [Coemansia sp. RSA 989]KAJ2670044.1 hypothetical protein IWW42_004244 [Coemansia sp. RSA 1085]